MIQVLGFDVRTRAADEGLRASRPRTNQEVVSAVRVAAGSASVAEVDLSGMTKISLDVTSGVVFAESAATGRELNAMLAAYDLMLPTGPCPSATIGAFLLQGGIGEGSPRRNLGSRDVVGVDLITAEGEIAHASASENVDLFRTIRTSPTAFAGLITSYYLNTRRLPRSMMTSSYSLPATELDELLGWLDAEQRRLPNELDVSIAIARSSPDAAPMLIVRGDAHAETPTDAHRALETLDRAPVVSRAVRRTVMATVPREPALQCCDVEGLGDRAAEMGEPWAFLATPEAIAGLHRRIGALPPDTHMHLRWVGVEE